LGLMLFLWVLKYLCGCGFVGFMLGCVGFCGSSINSGCLWLFVRFGWVGWRATCCMLPLRWLSWAW